MVFVFAVSLYFHASLSILLPTAALSRFYKMGPETSIVKTVPSTINIQSASSKGERLRVWTPMSALFLELDAITPALWLDVYRFHNGPYSWPPSRTHSILRNTLTFAHLAPEIWLDEAMEEGFRNPLPFYRYYIFPECLLNKYFPSKSITLYIFSPHPRLLSLFKDPRHWNVTLCSINQLPSFALYRGQVCEWIHPDYAHTRQVAPQEPDPTSTVALVSGRWFRLLIDFFAAETQRLIFGPAGRWFC